MNTSSPRTICWTGSPESATITLTGTDGSSCHTFNYGNICSPTNYYTSSGTISGLTTSQLSAISSQGINNVTISTGGSSYTIGSGNGIGPITFTYPEEWVDAFPDFARVQEMCKEYPGLKIAYEKFVTTYKLVKDHYDTPEDQRPKP